MEKNYLYGLTVQGIQSYIFETNKLKEIIGASEIVEKISTELLKEILDGKFNEKKLLLSAAGNVKYLFDDKSNAEKVYTEMPAKIIELAGNITFSQAIVEVKGNLTTKDFIALDKKLKANRNKPINEFSSVSMTRVVNRRTGEPAFNTKNKYQDFTTLKKLEKKDGQLLLDKIENSHKWNFPKDISEITNDKSKNYIAVVHADGNKLGSIIQKIIGSDIPDKTSKLKEMSVLIEKSTKEAFNTAFDEIIIKKQNFERKKDDNSKDTAPLRPVILGGDDITFIIRADLAVEFTNTYLKEFEKKTNENFKQLKILNLNIGLTVTAGIAFIKEKYPFHYGVHLADSICSYAKNLSKRQYSCMKFYKVQDSFVNDYNSIIEKEYVVNDFEFNKNPYKTDEIDTLLENVKNLSKESIPGGAIRELLTIMYQNKEKATFRWERIKTINKKDELNSIGLSKDALEDNKNIYDIITLDSLTVN